MNVIVDEGSAADVAARVRAGRLDLALAFQDTAVAGEEPARLEPRDLLCKRFIVALAPARGAAVALADLQDDDWTAAMTDGLIVRACRAAAPNLVSITPDQLAIRALVGRGLAVTLAPQVLAGAFADLALRPIDGPGPSRDMYVLLPPGGRHPLVAADARGARRDRPGARRAGRGGSSAARE
jgi:DNA-binding transcriptional LysR family regulator